LFTTISLENLPPAEQRLVEFLLLLPVAALMVCLFRVIIGLQSFGTFAPALLALCFRELNSGPGLVFFMAIILAGWLIRRLLDRYHLLQVPRMAFLLSLVVVGLLTAIVVAHQFDISATSYIALFPMVILTGMIERFWTLEVEDGAAASFQTLLVTMLMAWSISVVLDINGLVQHLFRYPETIGLVMAGQLVLGRYTGYRFMELYRFRDFMRMDPREKDAVDTEPVDWGRWYVESEQDSPWQRR
ncbi:MAG: 7TM domain-containing protein, partial [Mariprofundaceae bacterium]|nr:7TM domain-containing protein [Mariprofundaceae bacterium]